MKTKSPVTPNRVKPTKLQWLLTSAVVVLLAAVTIGFSWGAFSIYNAITHNSANDTPEAKQHFATLNAEVERLQREVMDPAGAAQNGVGEVRGSSSNDTAPCTIDVHCPTIGREWFVPMESGKEDQFLTAALQTLGYQATAQDLLGCKTNTSCGVTGTKDQFVLSANLSALRSTDKPPAKNISPKVWRSVTVRIDYYWGM